MFLTNLIHYEPITDLNIDHFKHRKVQTCHKAIMPFDPFLPETVVITWRHIMRLPYSQHSPQNIRKHMQVSITH